MHEQARRDSSQHHGPKPFAWQRRGSGLRAWLFAVVLLQFCGGWPAPVLGANPDADMVIVTIDDLWQGQHQADDPSVPIVYHDQIHGSFSAKGWWKWETNDLGRVRLEKVKEEVQVTTTGGGAFVTPSGAFNSSWSYRAEKPPPNRDGSPYSFLSLSYDRDHTEVWVTIADPLGATLEISGDGFTPAPAYLATKSAQADLIRQFPIYAFHFKIDPTQATFSKPVHGYGTYAQGASQGTYQSDVVVRFNQPPIEAIIEAQPDYENWRPKGAQNEEEPGAQLAVLAYLNLPEGKARYRVYLEDVSRQPGICMNFPHRDNAASKDPNPARFDLRIAPEGDLQVSEDGQEGWTTDKVESVGIVVNAYDYGAYGRIRVEAETDEHGTLVAHLKEPADQYFLDIPKDENQNHIADSWEKEVGTYGEIEDPLWDEADEPDFHRTQGDGISLYEKYRGFRLQGLYERLQPRRKYVFVLDRDGYAQSSVADPDGPNFVSASGGEVRFLWPQEWTGPGAAGEDKRLVNFNFLEETHAVDQHGLHLVANFDQDPTANSKYQELCEQKYGESDTSGPWDAPGTTWPDPTGGSAEFGSPAAALYCTVYFSNIERACRKTVKYHTFGLWPNYDSLPEPAKATIRPQAEEQTTQWIASHPTDWAEQNWRYIQTVVTHELGHGLGIIDLVEPRNRGPVECVMRYFALNDFPRNPDDRFELAKRTPPSMFCDSPVATLNGIPCRRQIKVTDREDASGASPARTTPRTERHAPARASGAAAYTVEVAQPAPALALISQLSWSSMLANDPLRVEVRLDCAQYRQAVSAAQLGLRTNALPALPGIAPTWPAHLSLALYRRETNQTLTPLLLGDTWTNYLRPQSVDLSLLKARPLSMAREWIVPADQLPLPAGQYVFKATWNGNGQVDPGALPPGGELVAPPIDFPVRLLSNLVDQATHESRLAQAEYATGAYQNAATHAASALSRWKTAGRSAPWETVMLAAQAEVLRGEYRAAAGVLSAVLPSSEWSEARESARGLLQLLSPELTLGRDGTTTTQPLTVTVLAGHRYRTEASSDLRNWQVLDERVAATNRFEVTDPETSPKSRYYRAVWLE